MAGFFENWDSNPRSFYPINLAMSVSQSNNLLSKITSAKIRIEGGPVAIASNLSGSPDLIVIGFLQQP